MESLQGLHQKILWQWFQTRRLSPRKAFNRKKERKELTSQSLLSSFASAAEESIARAAVPDSPKLLFLERRPFTLRPGSSKHRQRGMSWKEVFIDAIQSSERELPLLCLTFQVAVSGQDSDCQFLPPGERQSSSPNYFFRLFGRATIYRTQTPLSLKGEFFSP